MAYKITSLTAPSFALFNVVHDISTIFLFIVRSQPTNVILWIIKLHVHAERDTELTMTTTKIVSTWMSARRIMAGE